METIDRQLNPSIWSVLTKLVAVHLFASLATLSVCPQFGFRIFGEGMGLMNVFMLLGDYGCLVACGTFFMGSSLLLAALWLKIDEVRAIYSNRWLGIAALTLLSLGFFFMMDAQFVFGITMAWLIGAFLGGVLSLEIGWRLRVQSH
jgi:hypothetical protein